MARELPKREEIKMEYRWKIEDLYPNDRKWEEDADIMRKKTEELTRFRNHAGDNSGILLEMLKEDDRASELMEKLYVYANQRLHEDTGNSFYQNMSGKAQKLMDDLSKATAYMAPEILEISDESLERFYEEQPGLRLYRQYLINMRREKKHRLPVREEELLARAASAAGGPSDIYSMFNNADLVFPEITGEDKEKIRITHGRYMTFLRSRDQDVRRAAFQGLHNTYSDFRNTMAATFEANIKQSLFFAGARNYTSSRAMALSASNIPEKVYDSLIESVHEKLPLMYDYIGLRKEFLELNELHMYDLYVPLTEYEKKDIPFEEAKQMVLQGLKPLGEEYISRLEDGFHNGWIDIYENQGKRTGAYSWGAYGTHPFVLLNYQGELNDVFTLAHEMGHALHSYYSDEKQPYVYAGYKIFVAEVASTCNETLLLHYLLENAGGDEERAYLINYFLEQFRGTVFRQTMFAEFERETHALVQAGETLTADALCELYLGLNRKYFGEDVVIDKEIEIEWARIPHFYTPFYVYQYATGFSAAVALAGRILEGRPGAAEAYLQFLGGGSSDYPIELLKKAGVDMSTGGPVKEALKVFGDYIQMMKELKNK